MSDEIKNALTPEEWAQKLVKRDEVWAELSTEGDVEVYRWPSADWNPRADAPPALRHALAALCLYGQPFGFTREDVEGLSRRAENEEDVSHMMGGRGASSLRSLATRIAALLPPEETR